MCGRYTFTKTPKPEEVLQPEQGTLPLAPRYNIAPSQLCLIKAIGEPQRYQFFRWGLVPSWARDPKIGYKMINARSETVLEKPAFREGIHHRRCLIPADGFYEWKKTGKSKQPYRITLNQGQPFHFAGLSESWKTPAGDQLETFTILTIEPNDLMKDIHDRMPVILTPEEELGWLDSQQDAETLVRSLRPYPADQMNAYAVSAAVGNVRNDSPSLIEPAGFTGTLF